MKKFYYCLLATLVIIAGTASVAKANTAVNPTNDLSCIKVVCGLDEYTVDTQKDMDAICNKLSNLTLTEYSDDDVCGFTTITFIQTNGEERSIGLTSSLLYTDENCFSTDSDILSYIREIAEQ
ncbi:MAG: hypothetical protein Q4F05_12575 [bacterium]|nr:hypothetical protein [bacterium]